MRRNNNMRGAVMASIMGRREQQHHHSGGDTYYNTNYFYDEPSDMRHRDRRGRFTSGMDYYDEPQMGYGYPMYPAMTITPIGYHHQGERHHEQPEYNYGYYEHKGDMVPRSREEAEECVRKMKNADGTMGECFSFEEVRSIANKKGIMEDIPVLYYAMNKMKSKFYPMAKEMNQDNPDFYLKMAMANIKHGKLNHKH